MTDDKTRCFGLETTAKAAKVVIKIAFLDLPAANAQHCDYYFLGMSDS